MVNYCRLGVVAMHGKRLQPVSVKREEKCTILHKQQAAADCSTCSVKCWCSYLQPACMQLVALELGGLGDQGLLSTPAFTLTKLTLLLLLLIPFSSKLSITAT